ncbi:MAG: Crp/Fnr family transcriptional regulator [Myxococcales bacterium]
MLVPSTRQSGGLICAQGNRSPDMHFVKAGMVSLSTIDQRDGAPISLALRGPSSLLCPEAASGDASPFEVRAVTRVRMCSISRKNLDRWLTPAGSPARVMFELLLVETRLQRTDEALREGDCLRRVARFVLDNARFLEDRPDAVPKRVLARLLGMRPETLSRCLTRLEQCGAIDASAGVRVRTARVLSAMV